MSQTYLKLLRKLHCAKIILVHISKGETKVSHSQKNPQFFLPGNRFLVSLIIIINQMKPYLAMLHAVKYL